MFEQVHTTTLDNGVRVITSAIPHVASVSAGIWVGVGSRHESRLLGGASHFLEHLMFKGSLNRSALAITREIEGRGGYLNAFTQEENTCYYLRVPADKLRRSVHVLTDMYLYPRLAPAEVEKERQVIIEEMMMYRDEPQHYVTDILETALWPGHALGRPIIGDERSIGQMRRDDLMAFKNRTYTGTNTVFAFAGNLDHAACVALVAEQTQALDRGRRPTSRRFDANRAPRRLVGEVRSIEQMHLALGFRIFGRRDARRFPLQLLNTLLGGNMSSRLFQSVRERHGLAYAVHSSVQLYQDTGSLVITAGVDRGKATATLRLVVDELRRLRDRPVGRQELIRARDYVIGQLKLSMESTGSQMMWMGDNLLAWNCFIHPSESIAAFEAVTAADVQTLAGDIFRSAEASLAFVAPIDADPCATTIDNLLEPLQR